MTEVTVSGEEATPVLAGTDDRWKTDCCRQSGRVSEARSDPYAAWCGPRGLLSDAVQPVAGARLDICLLHFDLVIELVLISWQTSKSPAVLRGLKNCHL